MRFLVIEILGCVVWRPESTMRLKKPWSGWFNYPKHPKTTNFTMLHPSPKTLPRREPPVEPSVDATADLTEMEHFGNLWHRGRSGWLQLIWWCSMVFIFFILAKNPQPSTWSTWNQSKIGPKFGMMISMRLFLRLWALWSHPWTQPQIWQRWSTLAIFVGAVQGDFSWFDGVQWCSFFQKINVFNMEPIKICPKFGMMISMRLQCMGLRQNPQPCAERFPHGHHELVAQELDSAGTIARRLILCGTSMNIL